MDSLVYVAIMGGQLCMWLSWVDSVVYVTIMVCGSHFTQLVGALSQVNHKGLHQDGTQTSLCLQVIHFTSHHTKSHVF